MNKKKIIEKWLQKAREDLRLVEKELKTADPVYDAVAFHIQQFVEKYLKAFLISQEREIKKTRNIDYLLKQCIKLDSDFEAFHKNTDHRFNPLQC